MIEIEDSEIMQSSRGEAVWLSPYNIKDNLWPILQQARQQAMFIHALKKAFTNEAFDYSLEQPRWLSELGLCEAISSLELPDGFSVINSKVKLSKDLPPVNGSRQIWHMFGYNNDGRVLCFTFGQFYNPRRNIVAGERISYFRDRAPDLIHTYPELEIALLMGQREEIKQKLGLDYMVP